MIDGSSALTDDVALGIGDDQQLLIEFIHDGRIDGRGPYLAKPAAVLQDVSADELEPDFMVALGLRVELGVAPIGTVLREHPVQRPWCGNS